jgi:hypothetical protein
MDRECSRNEMKINPYRILVGKPKGNKPLRRPKISEWIILIWILRG